MVPAPEEGQTQVTGKRLKLRTPIPTYKYLVVRISRMDVVLVEVYDSIAEVQALFLQWTPASSKDDHIISVYRHDFNRTPPLADPT